MTRWTIIVEKANGNYSAYCPELPGCVATGNTAEETIKNMREAIKFHLEGLKLEGNKPHSDIMVCEIEV
ncbi:MAG: type II toxin-antitoxin system HicB family antitoxin [Deltaproteobacteria bacterium]|nr:type II toxin-antitoxin system HicB family antitoxin [Deltaproteobacteria bacterium]MBW2067767.1 type II toxin-antitoxin system HicB family antitoxin [Deltaproteobacteria bacterium]